MGTAPGEGARAPGVGTGCQAWGQHKVRAPGHQVWGQGARSPGVGTAPGARRGDRDRIRMNDIMKSVIAV